MQDSRFGKIVAGCGAGGAATALLIQLFAPYWGLGGKLAAIALGGLMAYLAYDWRAFVFAVPTAYKAVVLDGPEGVRYVWEELRDVPYFYFVGRLEHKKNISRMLQAFSEFKQKTGLPHKFLLAGKQAHGYEAIQQTYDSLPKEVQKDIEFLGFTPQDKATEYLRHAEALVFTTLFEGFGIPALEGFASGTPVITSNTTSMPEVVGDAAITVDPTSVKQIADAMENIAVNKKLRKELIEKGNEQYKKFSWEKAAKETLEVLEKTGNA